MIVYLDSSAIVRAYLPDEVEHARVRALIDDPETATITGSWSRVEVSSALVRAARAHRGDESALLAVFDDDVSPSRGGLVVVDAEQSEVELVALGIVRRSGIRSLDAWHLACAALAFEELAEPGEERVFATRDDAQAAVARELGFNLL